MELVSYNRRGIKPGNMQLRYTLPVACMMNMDIIARVQRSIALLMTELPAWLLELRTT